MTLIPPPAVLWPLLLASAGRAAWPLAMVPVAPAVHVAAVLADVQMTPNTNSLPGGQVLQNMINGLGGWALALALIGLVIGAAAWALGSHGQNYHQTYVGRRAVLVSGLAALLIGAGPAIVNFFFHAGTGVH
jgi:type IV secretory pathway VirB2 component (pilin)